MIHTEKLHSIIGSYKEYFPVHWEDEQYKWEAIAHFQKYWDIDAPDFGEMFKKATEKTSNLLASGYAYPRDMIIRFAKKDDTAVRNMFVRLFDENADLAERMEQFMASAEKIRAQYDDDSWKNHYQNTNAVSTYLWLRYPDKYYIYKYELFRKTAEELDDSYRPKMKGGVASVVDGYRMRLQMQRKQKLSCAFDEFSEDNLYNRILKTTLYRLIHAKDVDEKRRQALRKLIVYFGNVQLIQPDHIAWNRLIYQRNNRNYELLLNLCYLVLNGMLQTTEDGTYRLLAFSEEHMERLFEKFLLAYYQKHHPELHPEASQVKWNLTEKPDANMIRFLPDMYTDLTLHKGGKTLVIDAKYYGKALTENYGKASFRSAHLYQIFAYVKNLDKLNTGNVSGLLLYAKTADEDFPDGEPFMIGGNCIGVKALDLNQEFSVIAGQLEGIWGEYF